MGVLAPRNEGKLNSTVEEVVVVVHIIANVAVLVIIMTKFINATVARL